MDYTKCQESADLDWAIGLNRAGLKLVGLWPEVDKRKIGRQISTLYTFFIFTTVVCFLLIPEIASLLKVRRDMALIIDNLQLTLPILSAVAKFTILWWKQEAVSAMVETIKTDWLKSKNPIEQKLMLRQAKIARQITMMGYILTFLTANSLIILPIFGFSARSISNFTDPGRPLPAQAHYFYDVTKKSNFAMSFVGQSIGIIIAGTYYTVTENFLGLLVFHACGQMDNLSRRLTDVTDFENTGQEMSSIVKEHVRLIRFVEIVENTFQFMLLGQLLYFAILFCFLGFLMISSFKQGEELPISKLVWLIPALLTASIHMFLSCFAGESLLTCCDKIHSAAYNCKWYTLEPREAKKLTLLMARARMPLYITAANVFPMTIPLFCSLLKTSAGYVSVLLANM